MPARQSTKRKVPLRRRRGRRDASRDDHANGSTRRHAGVAVRPLRDTWMTTPPPDGGQHRSASAAGGCTVIEVGADGYRRRLAAILLVPGRSTAVGFAAAIDGLAGRVGGDFIDDLGCRAAVGRGYSALAGLYHSSR